MPEYQPVSSAHIAAIERPHCPDCKQNRMLLSKLEAGPSGFDYRTFECQKCGRVQTMVVSERPHGIGRARLACRRAQTAGLNVGQGTLACRISGPRRVVASTRN